MIKHYPPEKKKILAGRFSFMSFMPTQRPRTHTHTHTFSLTHTHTHTHTHILTYTTLAEENSELDLHHSQLRKLCQPIKHGIADRYKVVAVQSSVNENEIVLRGVSFLQKKKKKRKEKKRKKKKEKKKKGEREKVEILAKNITHSSVKAVSPFKVPAAMVDIMLPYNRL